MRRHAQTRHFDQFCALALYEDPRRMTMTLPDPPLTLAERRHFNARRTPPQAMGFYRAPRRVRIDSGLGLTTPTARKIGSTVGSSLLSIAPATGPAMIPLLIAGGIITAISAIFHGADPRQVPDTQAVELAEVAVDKVYGSMSGENIPDTGYGSVKGAPQPITRTNYPNVPYGATGNPNLDPDEASRQVQAISDASKSQLQLAKSAQNTFYTNWVPHIISIFQQMKQARAGGATASGTSSATSVLSSILPTGSDGSVLPYLLGGAGLLAVLALSSGGRE